MWWVINLSQEAFKIFLCSFDFLHFHLIDMYYNFSFMWNIHTQNHECSCALAFEMDNNFIK